MSIPLLAPGMERLRYLVTCNRYFKAAYVRQKVGRTCCDALMTGYTCNALTEDFMRDDYKHDR
jgi:hypothetical protein